MNQPPTSDEKIMAALAHGSVLLAFLGPIVPVFLWTAQRTKSKYVRFHALQAMGYQALMFWLWIAIMILIGVLSVFFVFPFVALLQKSHNPGFAIFLFQILILGSMFTSIAILFLIGLIGAIYSLLGRDFYYPFLGKWLGRYLAYDADAETQIDDAHEENWVAALCHATAILRFWGLATPLIVWFSQKERSARLRFQSMQALVYQLIATVAYILGMALYMAFFFGMIAILILGGATSHNQEFRGPAAAAMIIFFGVMLIFWIFIIVVMPIYYLLAGFASLRVIQGHHFRYPILGNMIEKRWRTAQKLEATA